MEEIRCFIAIELTENILRSLEEVQDQLRNSAAGRYARWTRPEGIHLTLKFLGNVPADRIEAISESIESACEGIEPFSFDVVGLGCFPSERRPRVLWTGVRENTGQLAALHRAVDREMEVLGYPPEKRAFHPHLTLARARKGIRTREQEALGRLITSTTVDELAQMRVERISLMRSDLRPDGAIYTELSATELVPV